MDAMKTLADTYYEQVERVRIVIDEVVAIMESDIAEEDEKAAAWNTVREALFPEAPIEL